MALGGEGLRGALLLCLVAGAAGTEFVAAHWGDSADPVLTAGGDTVSSSPNGPTVRSSPATTSEVQALPLLLLRSFLG
jgi:hypothetical protein